MVVWTIALPFICLVCLSENQGTLLDALADRVSLVTSIETFTGTEYSRAEFLVTYLIYNVAVFGCDVDLKKIFGEAPFTNNLADIGVRADWLRANFERYTPRSMDWLVG